MAKKSAKKAAPSRKRPLSPEAAAAAARLKAAWDERKGPLGLTQQLVADQIGGKTQGAVGHYLSGRTALNVKALLQFSAMLDIDPRSIWPDMEGLDQAMAGASQGLRVGETVGMYNAVYSAGDGNTDTQYTKIGDLRFRLGSLEKKGISPRHADVCFVEGRSMEPRLYPGDAILFDKRETEVTRDGKMYVVLWNGARLVKRLFRELDGSIRVSSDNRSPEYQDRIVHAGDSGFTVQGRVRWVGSWED